MIGGSFEISRFNKISRVEITKFPTRLISNYSPFSISFSKTYLSLFWLIILFVKKKDSTLSPPPPPRKFATSRRKFESHRSQFQSPGSVAEPKTCCIHIYSKSAVWNGITILCAVIRGGNFGREATQRKKEREWVVGRGWGRGRRVKRASRSWRKVVDGGGYRYAKGVGAGRRVVCSCFQYH